MPASAMILSAASAPMPSNDEERNCRKVRASLASSISCKRLARDPLGGRRAAVGQADLDHEGVAAIDGRRTRGRGVELARQQLVQALEDQLLADGHEAIGRRGGDLRLLDRLVQWRRPPAGRTSRGLLRTPILAASQIFRATDGLTRENDWMRNWPPSAPWFP